MAINQKIKNRLHICRNITALRGGYYIPEGYKLDSNENR